jgi:hypothetical protein
VASSLVNAWSQPSSLGCARRSGSHWRISSRVRPSAFRRRCRLEHGSWKGAAIQPSHRDVSAARKYTGLLIHHPTMLASPAPDRSADIRTCREECAQGRGLHAVRMSPYRAPTRSRRAARDRTDRRRRTSLGAARAVPAPAQRMIRRVRHSERDGVDENTRALAWAQRMLHDLAGHGADSVDFRDRIPYVLDLLAGVTRTLDAESRGDRTARFSAWWTTLDRQSRGPSLRCATPSSRNWPRGPRCSSGRPRTPARPTSPTYGSAPGTPSPASSGPSTAGRSTAPPF